jgi:predicted metal-dependent peptidase
MDLPGQISATRINIAVYLDNSASISDAQAAQFLAEVSNMQRQLGAAVSVFWFDVAVTPMPQKKIVAGLRQAGGGTRFESIFTDLAKRHQDPRSTVVVILTDGDGEASVSDNGYQRVLWILPEGKELSLEKPIGQVVSFKFAEVED